MCHEPRAEPSKTKSKSRLSIVVLAAAPVTRADQTDARAFSPSWRSTSPFSCITLSIVATVVGATGRLRLSPTQTCLSSEARPQRLEISTPPPSAGDCRPRPRRGSGFDGPSRGTRPAVLSR